MTPSEFLEFTITVAVSIMTSVSGQQQCNVQLPDLIHVKETDLPGTEIFNVSSPPGIIWTFDLDIPNQHLLKSYFNFSRNVAKQNFVMRLARTLDIEDIKRSLFIDLDVLMLSLFCHSTNINTMKYVVPLGITAVNEHSPTFNTSRINILVNETTPTGRILLKLINWSRDDDVNLSEREIYEFTLSANRTRAQADADDWIYLSNSYDGAVTLKKSLDYESLPAHRKYLSIGVTVKDVGGLSGSSTLILQVIDEDDLPPVFHFPGCVTPCSTTYSVEVSSNITGVITDITPGPIKATDGDALNYLITYHISQGPEDFNQYFHMNPSSGEVTIVKELEHTGLKVILLVIEAREVSVMKRSSKATLLITIQDGLSEQPPGHLLVIVIAIASVLFVIVILLAVSCLVWRLKYKRSQVQPEIIHVSQGLNARADNSFTLRSLVSPEGDSKNQKSTKLSYQEDIKMQQHGTTYPHISTEYSTQKSKQHYFNTTDVHVGDTSEFFQFVDCDDSQETEYAEVDIIITSPSLTTEEYSHNIIQPQHKSLQGSSTLHGFRFDCYVPTDIDHRVTTDRSERSLVLKHCGYTRGPLPVPTDTTVQALTVEEYPYATVKKVKPGLINKESEFLSIDAPDKEVSGVTSPQSPPDPVDATIDVYDATRDYQELEVCFSDYTDSSRASLVSGRSLTTSELMFNPRNSLYWTIVEEQEDFA